MRKAILMMLLAMASRSAAAAWVEIYPNDPGFTNYVDPASMKKTGDVVSLWHLGNRKEPANSYMSYKNLNEYNCANREYRTIDALYYTGKMATGTESHSPPSHPHWRHARPKSGIYDVFWMYACGKQ